MSLFPSRISVFETLEERRLLSNTVVSASLRDGFLRVKGTDEADVITVKLNASDSTKLDVLVGAEPTLLESFDLARAARGVRIDGRDGDDILTVDDTGAATPIKAFLRGGDGNDTLVGGTGDDFFRGGKGNDDLQGRGGRDRLRGDADDDTLDGGDDDDDVDGGRGSDHNRGGSGDDRFARREGDAELDDREPGDSHLGRDSRNHIPSSEVPAVVQAAFNAQFPGAIVREIELEAEDEGTLYKFKYLDTTGLRQEAEFDVTGQLVDRSNDDSGGGNDDGPNHDVGDDKGGISGGGGTDDGPNHDVGDDKGGQRK